MRAGHVVTLFTACSWSSKLYYRTLMHFMFCFRSRSTWERGMLSHYYRPLMHFMQQLIMCCSMSITWVHLSRDWAHLRVIGSSSPYTIESHTTQPSVSDLVTLITSILYDLLTMNPGLSTHPSSSCQGNYTLHLSSYPFISLINRLFALTLCVRSACVTAQVKLFKILRVFSNTNDQNVVSFCFKQAEISANGVRNYLNSKAKLNYFYCTTCRYFSLF